MGKLAFLFPGQGSQKVGMGADLLATDQAVFDPYLDAAEAASGLAIRDFCLNGPIESLTRTDVAQPALFALSLAVASVAAEMGLRPDFVAGHSLGEYTAAAVSGAVDPGDGMRLVCERGRLMGAIQGERPGAMAAVIGLPADVLQALCDQVGDVGLVSLANLNTPTQIVVSGEEEAVGRLVELAPGAGADKAVRLQVGAAFHTQLMKPVQVGLGELMDTISWNDPQTPLVANWSAQIVTNGAGIHDALVTQIASPVRWVECVQTLLAEGVTTFLELGSGRVLTGLVRQIHPDADAFAADSRKKLNTFVSTRPELIAG